MTFTMRIEPQMNVLNQRQAELKVRETPLQHAWQAQNASDPPRTHSGGDMPLRAPSALACLTDSAN